MNRKQKKLNKGLAIFLALLFLLSPIQSFAHQTYTMQVLIDESTNGFQTNVINDFVDPNMGREPDHMEFQMQNYAEIFMVKNGLQLHVSKDPKDEMFKTIGFLDHSRAPFSFNPYELGEKMDGKDFNHSGSNDAERAYTISENLTPGLNDAMFILNSNHKIETTKSLLDIATLLTSFKADGQFHKFNNRFDVAFGKRAYSNPLTTFQKNTLGVTEKDFMSIRDNSTKVSYEFLYRIPKGYNTNGVPKFNNKVYDPDWAKFYMEEGEGKQDVPYITWHMMIYQATYMKYTKGITMTNANQIMKVNQVEEFFVGMTQNTLNGIRNLLGLYNLNELIYNDGVRGTTAWVHGTMPELWHDNVVKYHMIFQGLAWSLISFAIVKSLIQRNLSTINPSMRASLIESTQNLLITGVILSCIFPLISMFMYLNVRVVALFSTLAPDMNNFQGLNNYSNALSGIILQCFYFIVTLYLNFVYIMRSITLAILIAMAPLFIVTIAFGGQWKQMFGNWMRELLSNIFLQSFHAFILAFFVTTTISSRGIESLIIAYAMIPLTEFFRSMVMGQGGGIAHKLGVGATSGALGMAFKGISASSKGISALMSNSKNTNTGKDLTSNSSSNSNDMAKTQQQPLKTMKSQGSNLEAKRASNNREIPMGIHTMPEGTSAEKALKLAELSNFSGGDMSGKVAGLKDAWNDMKPKDAKDISKVGKTVFDAGSGLAMAGLGMGAMLALGGSDPSMMKAGSNMVTDGLGKVKGSAKAVGDYLSKPIEPIREGMAMDKAHKNLSPASDSPNIKDNLGMDSINGGFRVHRDGRTMLEQGGIEHAYMKGDNAVVHYDSSRLSGTERKAMEEQAHIFASGTKEQKDWLKSRGIENVSPTASGGYAVTYNPVGKEKLGFEKIDTIGSGVNKSFMETKSLSHSNVTKRTFAVPPVPPVPSSPIPSTNSSTV